MLDQAAAANSKRLSLNYNGVYDRLGTAAVQEISLRSSPEKTSFHRKDIETGCKESQFYSLPFRQAVASMY